ncbi:SusC/RagA family TonB-linked outer membrane protein [Flavobacterium sp. HJJ]|uniref:SusC/RagA family TonB-linked outer membrane protein n=1 Tax=Flavobacterium sp. HJJ TaxID=2783792 RepID=UPI00188AA1A3|nr:SusC/RagA family TonB-linked outer membrane protein [Flavobacterium sp. HJJ]MBF4471705.1 SusC/RagA family TonB-linked outer membrane protein [Flavobacterium sp. HJJ]
MKKKPKNDGMQFSLFKIDLKLKLTTLLLLVAIFNSRADTYAQKTKVSLELKNSTVEKVIETIEQKTDFKFIYKLNDIDLDRVVSIHVKNQNINVVLDYLFKDVPTEIIIRDTQIMLKKPKAVVSEALPFLIQTVRGKVIDENRMPLSGATVTEQNTKNSVLTGYDGAFEISVQSNTAMLKVTYVGYDSKIFPASQSNPIIQLSPETTSLKEVVLVGYSSMSKRDVTGAVSSIAQKDMNQGTIVNPLQLISGKMAGVNINQVGSEPGSAPNIRIRGLTSLVGGSDPLVVIDGVQGNLDLLNQIPPSEIASIDILKDASAAAVYGARGAAGVVLVTTKKSKAGKTSVEYTGTMSVDQIPNPLEVLNADQWWQQAQSVGVPASANHGASTDWFNILTQTGFTQTHALAFGGGADKFNYRASISAILQEGVVINSKSNKYIGRIQATQLAMDDKLKLTFNLNSGIIETDNSIAEIGRASFKSNLITNSYFVSPTNPVYNTDGTYFSDPNVFHYLNPYAAAETVTNHDENNNLFGSLKAELEIIDGVTLAGFGSWRNTNTVHGYYLPSESTDADAVDQKGVANIHNDKVNERLMNVSINYKKVLGNHSLDVLALYEWQNQIYQGNFAQARGFINDIATFNALQLGDFSNAKPGDITSYKNDRTLISFLTRFNYSYLGRYLLTGSIRKDGSSVFGDNNKWGNFPSVSLGWAIDKEPFMANQTLFSQLKLRGGYGETGNQQGLYPQQSLSLVGQGSPSLTYFGGSQITNYIQIQNANPDLKWETKKQTNIGIDFALFENRLRGTIDAYTATTENLLFNYTVPQPPYPYDRVYANVGSLLNEGLEASLSYDLISNENTTLTLAGNVSFMRNEVLNLSGSIDGVPLNTDYVGWGAPNSYLVKGKPVGSFYTLHSTGKDNANSETVLDRDGNGIIDQGSTSPDRAYNGAAMPTYTFAFNPTFRYKKLDISMLWRGSGGNKIYNTLNKSLSYQESIGKSNVLTSSVALDMFTTPYVSDLWLEKGDFIRLDNITLGYNFTFKEVKYLESLRLTLNGSNLLLFTDYTGMDPEINLKGNGGDSNSHFGDDIGIYPRTRTFGLGLSVKFK